MASIEDEETTRGEVRLVIGPVVSALMATVFAVLTFLTAALLEPMFVPMLILIPSTPMFFLLLFDNEKSVVVRTDHSEESYNIAFEKHR